MKKCWRDDSLILTEGEEQAREMKGTLKMLPRDSVVLPFLWLGIKVRIYPAAQNGGCLGRCCVAVPFWVLANLSPRCCSSLEDGEV